MKRKVNNSVNYFLFKIIIIFIFFDGIRNNLLYGEYISQIKELVTIILFFITISKISIKNSRILNIGLLLFFIDHSIIGILSSPFFMSFSSFTVFYKQYQLLMLIYAFYYFSELTGISISRFLTFIVKVGVFFVIINTFLYFVELPIWKDNAQNWWGRIGRGYPTMDVISLSYVLIILLYLENLNINLSSRLFYVCIIFLGILLQATGTGIVIISCIIVVSVLYFIFFKSSSLFKKNIIISGFIIFIMAFLLSLIMNKYYPQEYERMSYLMKNKSKILLKEEVEDENINTLAVRENQYNRVLKYQDTEFKQLFGVGLGKATYNASLVTKNRNYIYIEDQYSLNQICYGYVGYLFYVFFIVIAIWEVISIKNILWQIKIMFFLAILIFALNSKTLIPLVLFSNTAFFAFFYATLKRIKNDRLFYLKNFYLHKKLSPSQNNKTKL